MIDLVRLHSGAKQKEMIRCIQENNFSQSYMYADLISQKNNYPITGIQDGYTFKANEKQAYAFGSFHKYWNKKAGRGAQNWNDFYFNDVCQTIDRFLIQYPFMSDFHITRLEIGFNLDITELELKYSVKDLIKDCFHFYDWNVLPTEKTYDDSGYMKEFMRSQYSIKVYDKSSQFKLKDKSIIRIELKMISKKEFANLGIYHLEHLKNKAFIEGLFQLFIKRFDKLMIVDPVAPDGRISWKKDLFNYLNPMYWRSFKRTQKEAKRNHKNAAIILLDEKGLLTIKEKLKKGLEAKFLQLLHGDPAEESIGTISTIYNNGISPSIENHKTQKGGNYES